MNLARINSHEVKKNDVFFAIKGKKNDGNKFVNQAFKNKASIAVVNKFQKKSLISRQIKVQNTLKFLTKASKIFRGNINTNIIENWKLWKNNFKRIIGEFIKKNL